MDEKANQKSLFCESQDHDVYLSQEDDRSCTDRQVEKSNEVKNILNKYSEPSSLDYSPSSSIFESEELDSSTFENDAFERESGVESVDGDWPQSCNTPPLDYDLDLTEEQALETLKYFTLSLSRANQMTKTHQDLEAVLQLLQEKEKDLEMAAHIGQSLLERNRNLYKKTETLESYVNEVEERETQLKHVVTMKDKLLQTFIQDQDMEEDYYSDLNRDSDSSAYESCKDESMISLYEKCNRLEAQNSSLILEALKLREETDKEEEKEKQLVYECIKELADAKEQISHLTDEISLKAQDNLEQQDEISKLISTVLELQNRHNHLTEENEELHETLKHSQENQKSLQVEVSTLHEKYQECYEMLMENQQEMKMMREKFGSSQSAASDPDPSSQAYIRQDPRESLAQEIEETVRRDIETLQEKKKHTNRVMQTVRAANTTKRFPKAIKGGSRPIKGGQTKSGDKPFDFSFAASANSPRKNPPSMDDLRAAVRRLSISENASHGQRGRRSWAPEKLQIVKPMEGSATLHKWQSLARPTMSGLHDVHPGVHVKGEVLVKSEVVGDKSSDRRSDAAAERKNQVTGVGKTKVQTKPTTRRNDNGNKGTTDCNKVDNEATKPASEQSPNVVTQTTLSSSTLHLTSKPAVTLGKVVSTDNVAGGTSANLTEIVKSKLSVEKAVSPENEPGLLLNKILRSTAGISADLVNAVPVTTIAKTSFVPTTTTSSITVSTFPRPLLVRSRSSENLMNLAKPFGEQGHAETTTSTTSSSVSNDSFSAPSDTSATSLGFSGFVGRLVRSSSSENLAGTQNANVGLSRSSSSGKLSDLLKNSDIYATIGKAPSLDTAQTNKRVSPQLGDSPPSPSRLELMGDLGGLSFFGLGTSSTPASEAATTTMPSTATSTSKSILSGLSGLGGFFRPRSKSLDNLGPLPNNFNSQKLNGNQSNGRTSLVQRSLKRFHQAFGPD